jgi:uncharacterized protein (TIGR00661 family)
MNTGGRRKILYGVHGYGRGHAARAQAILPELVERYDVRVLAGDEAYDQLHRDYSVMRIPTLRYHHDRRGRRSAVRTIARGIPAVADLLLGGAITRRVRSEMERFRPDVVLSDSEGWTHRAARSLGIPRISFDHYGILVHCDLEMPRWDRLILRMESLFYRFLVPAAQRTIVAAFYDGRPRHDGVTVVGAILRKEARETMPTRGEHLLAYFSNASVNFTPEAEQALRSLDLPVKVYGPARKGPDGNLEFRPTANLPFLADLASCRAVLATAGNQLISEAIHFGKPLLLMPEQSLEQRLNAQFVTRWRIGMQTRPQRVTGELLRTFLGSCEEFAANIPARRRDGLAEAMAAIDRAVEELAPTSPKERED